MHSPIVNPEFKAILFAIVILIGMFGCLEFGRLVGKWRIAKDPEGADKGIGAADGAVFALFGLLLAFTFSGATSRFDHRRELIVQEANAIGTAYLRIDLLPMATQQGIRSLFRQYVEARIALHQHFSNPTVSRDDYLRGTKLQDEIWKLAVAGVNASSNPPVSAQIFPPLNDMIDISNTRIIAAQTHPPEVIFFMLFGLALLVSLLAGYAMSLSKTRQWMHLIVFSIAITSTLYVIIDIEYPRFGEIRIDAFDQILVDVLDRIK